MVLEGRWRWTIRGITSRDGRTPLGIIVWLGMLCYRYAAGAIVITRIALNMETGALEALEHIPPSSLEFSMPTRKKNRVNGIP